jgi:hypothetical protein
MNRLRQWWRRMNEPTVVVAHAAKGGIASVVVVNGKSVQVEQRFRCCRPDCPYAKAIEQDDQS